MTRIIMITIIALVVVAIFATTTAHAAVYSRDFGDEDAERLMRLAQAELDDACADDKAMLMLKVLERVWSPLKHMSVEKAIMNGGFASVGNGTYQTAIPDSETRKALEMIREGFNGYPDKVLITTVRIVRTLEYVLPMLLISATAAFLWLVSIGLGKFQNWLGKR